MVRADATAYEDVDGDNQRRQTTGTAANPERIGFAQAAGVAGQQLADLDIALPRAMETPSG